jgi:hypothetical protein
MAGHRSAAFVAHGVDVRVGVHGAPSLSAAFLDQVLSTDHSPAAGSGSAVYQLSQTYGIDDAFALGFFWNESNFGRAGEARITHSPGNLRCLAGVPCVDSDRGGYAWFPTWSAGFAAWFQLIAGPLYVGAGLVTVPQIVHRYAPTSDANNEAHYVAVVEAQVALWRSGRLSA